MNKFLLSFLFLLPVVVFGQSAILRDVNVVDVINGQILSGKDVVIRDGMITAIQDNYEIQPGDTAYMLSGKFVMPGLIDSHTHIEHSAYWTNENKYNPPRENLIDLLEHALLGGVTIIREMAGDVRVAGELSRGASIGLFPSPDIYYSSVFAGPRFFQDPRAASASLGETPGEVSWFRGITDETDFANVVAQAKGNGSYAIKQYALLTPGQIEQITKEADRQGLKVWSHAFTQQAKPSEVIGGGVNSVSHAPLLLFELSDKPDYSMDPGDKLNDLFALMKENKVSFDPTLFVYKNHPGAGNRSVVSAQIVRRAHAAGVTVIAGTDSISAYRQEAFPFIHKEIVYYVNECGFSPAEALKTATINPAETLGIAEKTGSVDAGKQADLVILEANPLENIENTTAIYGVMKSGTMYLR